MENYNTIYPGLKAFVGRKQLNDIWCVIVPFFTPIEKEAREESLQFFKKKGIVGAVLL